jgi:hypothetical protein
MLGHACGFALANKRHDTQALGAKGRGPEYHRLGACYAQLVGSVQCRFVFVFGNSVSFTKLFEPLSFAIYLFKNTLAGQFGFAATLTKPNSRVFSV